jgi:predicted ATPase
MSRVARRSLHQKAGAALEELYSDDLDDVVYDLAAHYSHTRELEKSIEYNLLAGNKALLSYAPAEATRYLEVGVEGISALADKILQGLEGEGTRGRH